MANEKWMEEARGVAAQCWCDQETSRKEMDVVLAEAFAKRLAAWMDDAAREARNVEFYRGLLDECAKRFPNRADEDDAGGRATDIVLTPNANMRGEPVGESRSMAGLDDATEG